MLQQSYVKMNLWRLWQHVWGLASARQNPSIEKKKYAQILPIDKNLFAIGNFSKIKSKLSQWSDTGHVQGWLAKTNHTPYSLYVWV